MGIAPDNIESITALIRKAKDADIIVPVGGASVGDHDYMRGAFKGRGLTSVFEKVAVRPGKPKRDRSIRRHPLPPPRQLSAQNLATDENETLWD